MHKTTNTQLGVPMILSFGPRREVPIITIDVTHIGHV